MTDMLDYPDNLVLHLERERRSYKCFTTDVKDKFKILNGLCDMDNIVDTKYLNIRELKQLLVDSVINGYTLKTNLIFKKGFHGIVNELAEERMKKLAEQESLTSNEINVEVVSDEEVCEKNV